MLEKDQAHTFSRLSSRHIGWDFAPKFMQEASDLFFFFFNSAYLTFLRAKVFFSDMGDAAYRDVSQSSCSLVKQEQGWAWYGNAFAICERNVSALVYLDEKGKCESCMSFNSEKWPDQMSKLLRSSMTALGCQPLKIRQARQGDIEICGLKLNSECVCIFLKGKQKPVYKYGLNHLLPAVRNISCSLPNYGKLENFSL